MAKKTRKELSYDSIESMIESIVVAHGEGSISRGISRERTKCDAISTGALNLDAAIGIGGVPRGRITEIFGPFSSGKTTLALEIAANAQREGGTVAFVDVEHALDPSYASALGVDMNAVLFSQPDSAESALDIVEIICGSGKCSLVIVDSVAALVPQAELDGNMGDSHVGLHARLLSQACRKLKGIAKQTNTALIFINQIREKIGVMFGSPETTSGGRALPFYASVRLDIRKIATLKGEGEDKDRSVANQVRVKVVKNKVGDPFTQAEFDIIFGKGINKIGCLLDTAVERNVVAKRGSNYYYNTVKLGQAGRPNACVYLEGNPELCKEIRVKTLESDYKVATGFKDEESDSSTEPQDEKYLED